MLRIFKMTINKVSEPSAMAQRALPSAIEDLQSAVIGLESTFYNLQSQLHPILDATLVEDAKGNGVAPAPYHYSAQVSDLTSRIRALSTLGQELISRLHV
jgi:hypothetical protein